MPTKAKRSGWKNSDRPRGREAGDGSKGDVQAHSGSGAHRAHPLQLAKNVNHEDAQQRQRNVIVQNLDRRCGVRVALKEELQHEQENMY